MDIRQKKQKKVEPGSADSDVECDVWIFNFVKIKLYLMISFEVGNKDLIHAEIFFVSLLSRCYPPF